MQLQPANEFLGKKYGLLTVTHDLGYSIERGKRMVLVLCDCGTIKEVGLGHLKDGTTKSCGCMVGHNGIGVSALESIGQRFGKMVVQSLVIEKNKKPIAVCLCDCGNEKNVRLADLRKGSIRSCGCILSETSKDRMTKHGLSSTAIYKIWKGIKKRCYDEKEPSYPNYGGRGVVMCDEWLNNPAAFCEWSLNNGWAKGLEIDKDIKAKELGVDALLYSPERCVFVTPAQNSRATRRNVYITHNGQTKIAADWAIETGVDARKILYRFRRGYSLDKVFAK